MDTITTAWVVFGVYWFFATGVAFERTPQHFLEDLMDAIVGGLFIAFASVAVLLTLSVLTAWLVGGA